jgi:hypothetical protein
MIFKHLQRPDVLHVLEMINKHLNQETHISSLIIKGHLVVEYTMNLVIKSLHDGVKSFDEKRTKFSEKVRICDMYGVFTFSPEVYEQITKLNDIRNDIAHNLNYDVKQVEQLYKHHKKNLTYLYSNIPEGDQKEFKKLTHCIGAICGHILGVADFKIQLNNYALGIIPVKDGNIDREAIGYDDVFQRIADEQNITIDSKGNLRSKK